MTIAEMLLPEFDQEMSNTRKLLAIVPEDKADWKPHDKSMSMARLAGHVADLPSWALRAIHHDSFNINPGENKPFMSASPSELLAAFDKHVAEARKAISGASDEHFGKSWTLSFRGQPMLTMPRAAVVRTMMMNHLIHHRGQLGVYLRLNNVAIPGMYGPSADQPVSVGKPA